MCQNYLAEIELLKQELKKSEIAYNVLLSSHTAYIERIRQEVSKLRTALAATQQNKAS